MKVKYFLKALIRYIITFTIIFLSCERDNDNNQNPLELKITDINLSNCIDSIDSPRLHLKMIDDNKLKITHYGAEFCCSDTGKADVELTENNDIINLKEIDLGPYTYCFCKHNLDFTISGIDYGKQKFKIIESEHAYQQDTFEFNIDISPSTDTLIHRDYKYQAKVIGKGLDCGETYVIEFDKQNSQNIKTTEWYKEEWYRYYADSLPNHSKVPGKEIKLNCRKPNENELYPCTHMGPSYPHVIITDCEVIN